MPSERTPRSSTPSMRVPSGRAHPGSTTGTIWPAATFGAPQTIRTGAGPPHFNLADGQAVGPRVGAALQHPSDDDARKAAAQVLDALGLQAGHGQAVDQLFGRRVDVHVLAQPVQRDLHPIRLFSRSRTGA